MKYKKAKKLGTEQDPTHNSKHTQHQQSVFLHKACSCSFGTGDSFPDPAASVFVVWSNNFGVKIPGPMNSATQQHRREVFDIGSAPKRTRKLCVIKHTPFCRVSVKGAAVVHWRGKVGQLNRKYPAPICSLVYEHVACSVYFNSTTYSIMQESKQQQQEPEQEYNERIGLNDFQL